MHGPLLMCTILPFPRFYFNIRINFSSEKLSKTFFYKCFRCGYFDAEIDIKFPTHRQLSPQRIKFHIASTSYPINT